MSVTYPRTGRAAQQDLRAVRTCSHRHGLAYSSLTNRYRAAARSGRHAGQILHPHAVAAQIRITSSQPRRNSLGSPTGRSDPVQAGGSAAAAGQGRLIADAGTASIIGLAHSRRHHPARQDRQPESSTPRHTTRHSERFRGNVRDVAAGRGTPQSLGLRDGCCMHGCRAHHRDHPGQLPHRGPRQRAEAGRVRQRDAPGGDRAAAPLLHSSPGCAHRAIAARHSQDDLPFKGQASYWSAQVGDELYKNLVWSYERPIPRARQIAGLMCFYNERVQLTISEQHQQDRKTSPCL
jgi:hypothetical protein